LKEMIKLYFPKDGILKSYIVRNRDVERLDELLPEEYRTEDPEQLIRLINEKIQILSCIMERDSKRDTERHDITVNPKIKFYFDKIVNALRGLYLGVDVSLFYSYEASTSKFLFSSRTRDILINYVMKKYNINEENAIELLKRKLFSEMKLRRSSVLKRFAIVHGIFRFKYEYIDKRKELIDLINEFNKTVNRALEEMTLEESRIFDRYKPRLSAYINEFTIFSSDNTYINVYYPRNIDEIISDNFPLITVTNAIRIAIALFTSDITVTSKLAEFGRMRLTASYKNYIHDVNEHTEKLLNIYEKTLSDAIPEIEKCTRKSKLDSVRKRLRDEKRKYTFDQLRKIFSEWFGKDADKMLSEAFSSGYVKYTDDGYFVFEGESK